MVPHQQMPRSYLFLGTTQLPQRVFVGIAWDDKQRSYAAEKHGAAPLFVWVYDERSALPAPAAQLLTISWAAQGH